MNQDEIKKNLLDIESVVRITIEQTTQENYKINYPSRESQELEFYLSNQSIVRSLVSACPKYYIGVIYYAYINDAISRDLAEKFIKNTTYHLQDELKIQVVENGFRESSLLEIGEKCYEDLMKSNYKESFEESCQRIVKTEPCVTYKNSLNRKHQSFLSPSHLIEGKEEKICIRMQNLKVIDNDLDKIFFENTAKKMMSSIMKKKLILLSLNFHTRFLKN